MVLVSQENLIPEIIKHTNVQIININKQQSKKKAVPNKLIVEIVKDFIKTSGKIDNEAIKIDENMGKAVGDIVLLENATAKVPPAIVKEN